MKQTRVLLVDDSPTVRAVLGAVLRSDPSVLVVGEARNGEQALALVRELKPDIVTMDLHMPVMDGLAATRAIMEALPTPILLMTGAEDGEDVALSFEVLRAGAVAVTSKPSATGADINQQWARLIELVKALADVRVVQQRPRASRTRSATTVPVAAQPHDRLRVIGVGASAGGPTAIRDFLLSLPASVPLPVFIVQHIAPEFTSGFARWLGGAVGGKRSVVVAEHGARVAENAVYVAPAARHLGVARNGTVSLSDEPTTGGFRPSVTFLFNSLAETFGAGAVGVVLSGMGSDGLDGVRSLRAARGLVIAQDRESSLVFGMPGAVADAGLADELLEPSAIGGYIASVIDKSRSQAK